MVDAQETVKFLIRFKSKEDIESAPICASIRGNKITFDVGCQLTSIESESARKTRKEEASRISPREATESLRF